MGLDRAPGAICARAQLSYSSKLASSSSIAASSSPTYKNSLMDWTTQILIFVVFGFEIAGMIIKIWECVPRASMWDENLEGRCVNFAVFMISSGVFNTVTDIVILFLPIKAVWSLHMSTKAKLGIISIFTIGLTYACCDLPHPSPTLTSNPSAPVFSLVGMIIRIEIAPSTDVTYNQPKIHLFAAAEIASGLLCLCMPTLAALKPSHRANLKRPSISILQGATKSRRTPRGRGKSETVGSGEYGLHTVSSGRMKSMDEPDSFDFDVREGRDGDGKNGNEERHRQLETCYPIDGGRDSGRGDDAGHGGGGAILRTVEIEQMQTYV
ncbi:hypothetical protein ACLMJK_009160 [Lecanora helva]